MLSKGNKCKFILFPYLNLTPKQRKILEKTHCYSIDYLIIYFLAERFLRNFHLLKKKLINL